MTTSKTWPAADLSEALIHTAAAPPAAPPDRRFLKQLPGRLAAVTCLFNPCGYASQRRNYQRFAAGLKRQGVPLYVAELAFDDRSFFLAPGPTVLQLRTDTVLWHKERLLNLLIARLPAEFDKVAWLDADLLFDNAGWAAQTARLLEEFPVVQLFESATYLDAAGRGIFARPGVAWAARHRPETTGNFGLAHPGFAWAARRELLARHALPDCHVLGGGDSMLVCALYGWWTHPLFRRNPPAIREEVTRWGRPVFSHVAGRVGFVPGGVRHLYHGTQANRRYAERTAWLDRERFDPRRDLRVGSDGLFQWATNKPDLHRQVATYFRGRREDE